MNIQMPTHEEKERAIHTIVRDGLPHKQSILVAMPELFKTIGLRNLFWGTEDCIFLAIICAIAFALVFVLPITLYSGFQYLALFIISPLFYSLLHIITAWKELQNGTYEIKMTCHYTLRELTALRMLFFSGFSVILDVLLAGVVSCLPTTGGVSVLQLIGISLSALFLYGAVTMFVLIKGLSLTKQLAVPALWSILCLLPFVLKINVEAALLALPNVVVLFILLVAVCCYFIQLRIYCFKRKKGGRNYAIG